MPGGGGLLQLVATGKQDVFLTGNPQMTFFKMVYRRYTNFAIESQAMYFDGDPDFGKRLTTLVPRRGDLLGPMILEIVLPPIKYENGGAAKYVNAIGHAIIEEITLEIGEQEIDKQTGEWMEIWSKLTIPAGLKEGYSNMIGRVDGAVLPFSTEVAPTCSVSTSSVYEYGSQKLYIPLQFWFNKNPGLYLPLIAMQYHPIRINVKLRGLQELVYNPMATGSCSDPTVQKTRIVDIRLWGDYVMLDTEERRRFVANNHEYLIEQIQYTPRISIPEKQNTQNVRLEFNHPLREIIWFIQREYNVSKKDWFNYSSREREETGAEQDIMQEAVLQVDGFDRFERRDAGYFRFVQPFQYHTNIPTKDYFYTYSFALRPEEMQPSGALNASRIDNMVLQVTCRPDSVAEPSATVPPKRGAASIRVYAKNHNILRVVGGFAGLLFRI